MSDSEPIQLSDEQIQWLKGLKMSKRAGVVRDHILKHGSITTQVLSEQYGYGHPPRARGDLQDAGVGVGSRFVVVDGKRMAEYYFTGDATKNAAGRVVIPKPFSDELKKANGYACAICSGVFAGRELQADHRVPFMIGGDKPDFELRDFMPLCASDNRAKSWSCEHCPNRITKDISTCESCFWAHPENYTHVETRPERRVTITFQGEDVLKYDEIASDASAANTDVPGYLKSRLLDE